MLFKSQKGDYELLLMNDKKQDEFIVGKLAATLIEKHN